MGIEKEGLNVSFIFYSFLHLSKAIVLPISGSRNSYYVWKEEGFRNGGKPLHEGEREKDCCLQKVAYMVSRGWHCSRSRAGRLLHVSKVGVADGLPKWDLLYLVRVMPSSAGGIVMKPETGETKGSSWFNPEWGFGWHTQQQDKFAKEATVWEMQEKKVTLSLSFRRHCFFLKEEF